MTTAPATTAASTGTLPAAVLWDMDGTLVDTEPYWIAAEHELVDAHGGTWSHEQALQLVGNSLPASARILQAAGVRLGEAEIVEFLLDRVVASVRTHVPWRPGARELLRTVADAGVPCALVTMSYRRFAAEVVAQTDGALRVVVTGDDVAHGKPHPEAYLTAAERLGVPIDECVAIEDSPTGIASALASGARTLGVEAVVPVPPQPGLSRARSLEQVSLRTLAQLHAGHVIDLT
ncbi:HAD-superfamily hydrolase, subfamily IA, variant 3 [Xylanimonas cellulosilytica DSM 15894]|uniref:HAD-superfamily hydrolase, subfamily IA, variant 3 n=1 Tax=Xylanimonas cellulosilytica (strain DSM 15894 / JCM 12276 / CECT 5975 / KCTC 9989 / LMG 20990 / NBRC 107835 / XIL07) TaxID=446471 RepID=D1BS19_XYLCX|nr:HAD family phosphatase [Xylanimonas cellulosilytica]ACZ30511.1 HAD-superfamily hydrolase, subfamily IA, variant 3 [Xylanimonas cellulosilytica DSM 15894]